MFLITDKIAILISILSFVIFTFWLTGIYLFINCIFNPYLFIQKENHIQGRKECSKTGNANKINPYSFIDGNINNDGSTNKFNPTVVLFNFFEKRKKYVVLIFFIILFLTFFIFFKNMMLAIFIAIMGTGIFIEFIDGIIRKRKEALDIQLIEFITNIIIMLKAGKEIRQIFKESLAFIKKPLNNYIKTLVSEVELNISMDSALDNFAFNIGGKEVSLLANAIKINRKIGGNLLFILENIIKTLQENLKIRSSIKTQTAQSRFSGNFISLFPLAGFICMYFSINSSLKEFLLSKPGSIILAAGAILEFSGFFIIKKILKEEQA
ncbi:MAG: type II secretion system F family protein [Candidatus Humimicrobiaceae bacterium]